nr:nif-specific transcriptional activator NifA [Hartmannibacter diazotrophicus]
MAADQRSSPDVGLVGIYEISKILSAPAPLERTLANVANVLSSFLQMRLAMLVILDGEGDPEIVATAGWAGTAQGKPIETLPQLVIDRIVATETAVVVQDIDLEPLFERARDLISVGTKGRISFIGVPIKAGDRVVGTLSIDRVWDGATRFRIDDDVRFLTMVANLVGQTVRLHQILAADRQRLLDERRALEKALSQELADRGRLPAPKVGGIVGESNAIKKVMETVSIVAKSNSTVLLRGESGTGKELFARAIHDLSARKTKPFIKVNCAALPETVLESELFGHEKGAFTGALAQRAGRFEMANGGTLFLDEIGEISAAFQAKLLRVLQEGEFERVGGNKTLKVDVRLVCATNKNLEEAVTKGEFRADLYYRINVVPVALPPLRDRPGDIPLLARAFIQRFNKENGRQTQLSQGAVETLKKCYFPGNVRELENCVRRTATLARGEMIGRDDFACATGNCLSALLWTGSGSKAASDPIGDLAASRFPSPAPRAAAPVARMPEPVARDMGDGSIQNCEHADEGTCPALGSRLTEKQRLVEAMERSGWVQAKAARLLGLTPRQIGYALKKHGVELKRF